MRTNNAAIEHYRLKRFSSREDGNNGAFIVPFQSRELRVIASDGEGWEHVSVSLSNRCPNWPEMCFIKNLFWEPEEAVMQLHPPQSTWVNNHEYCLHLWKPIGQQIPLPAMDLVGIQGADSNEIKKLGMGYF